jgi:hypothetical protein
MAGMWGSFQDVKKVALLVIVLLVLMFACGFCSGIFFSRRAAHPSNQPCNLDTGENCDMGSPSPCDPTTTNCSK